MERKSQSIIVRVGNRATMCHMVEGGGEWRIRKCEWTPPSRPLHLAPRNLFSEKFGSLQDVADFVAALMRSGEVPSGDDGYGGSALQRFSFPQ
jgi:hypothetical protein